MNLSKSKYCRAIQCKKMLWLDKYKPEESSGVSDQSTLDNGTDVGNVAKDLFGFHVDVKFDDLNVMIKDTSSLLNLDKLVITEASFLYENNFCSVDILKKDGKDYEIYEVKSSTEVKDIYISDISYQVYILSKLGYNVTRACVIYINSRYERNGNLALDKLFNVCDVTDIAFDSLQDVERKIKEIDIYMEQSEEPFEKLNMHCVSPYDCPYFKYCTKGLPNNNVFDIRLMRNSKKFDLYNKGIFTYDELLNEDISDKYKQQIEFELFDKEPYINKNKIKEFLNTLSYPLYFLDFETFQQPIPMYDKIRPYDQIPFQYSLHYTESDDGMLFHKEFLALPDIDPRRDLAEGLVRDIPKNVCVLAYNMSFEKRVIKNLASLFSDLSEHLMNIYDNMHDLMIPFYNRNYYSKDMHGSYSIKYVLPALFPNDPSLNYHNLQDIHNGGEAMNGYAQMGSLSKEEQERLRDNLLKYCCLDTYAMVKIYEKLRDVVK